MLSHVEHIARVKQTNLLHSIQVYVHFFLLKFGTSLLALLMEENIFLSIHFGAFLAQAADRLIH